jgi:hypothetical protein
MGIKGDYVTKRYFFRDLMRLRSSWPFTSRFEFREFRDAKSASYCASLILQHFVKSKVQLPDTELANAHDDRLLLRIHGTKKNMDRGGWRPR